jgi:hypothetical protein
MYYPAALRSGDLASDVETCLKIGMITQEDLQTKNIVLSSLLEGQDYQEYLLAIDQLKSQSWFDERRCFWLGNVFNKVNHPNVTMLPYYMANFSSILSDYNWTACQRDRYFVCLLRRDSPSRRKIAKTILDNYSVEDYRISYRSYLDKPEYDPVIQRDAPLLLDAISTHHGFDGFPIGGILQCVINLIAETSIQDDVSDYCWGSMFVTEKTFKSFGWRQMPLWLAVPGMVSHVRAAGFDLFDDWLENHDYDNIPSQELRFQRVFEILTQCIEKIKSLGGSEQASQLLASRFDHNIAVLNKLDQQNKADFSKFCQQLDNLTSLKTSG